MRISKSTKTSVKASKKVCASQDQRVIYDKDGIKVTTTGRNYDFIATIENDTDEEYCVEELGLCVPAHDWVGFLADDEGYADLEYFESLGGVKACRDVKASAEPNTPNVNKSKLVRQIIKQAKEIRDYFQSHNNNLNRTQEQYLEDLSDGIDNESVMAIREAVEELKYNSKNLRKEQYYLIEDLYDEFNLADGKFEGMGRPGSGDVDACGDIKSSTSTEKALQHIKAAIDILGKSGDKSDVTKDSIANLATVMFDIKANKQN